MDRITADLSEIAKQAETLTRELIEIAKPQKGSLLVVGCSSSEITGGVIGHASSEDTAKAVFDAIYSVTKEYGLYLAAQCCEHLNRALIVEQELAEKRGYEIVNALPQVKAGGGFATAAYNGFSSPVAVESVKAELGLDIGQTLIGMHLRAVAVPVRLSAQRLGNAVITCARTRPKYIGGERAKYIEY